MRYTIALAVLLASTGLFACSLEQPKMLSQVAATPASRLPFTGRLIDGDPSELPPAAHQPGDP